MAKTKNKVVIVIACLMLAVLCAVVLAACNDTETYTVTFMVRENGTTGDWQQYTTVDTNDDGSVTLPTEPTVDGYTFRDWYTDEACSADNVFDETSVSGDITVYALMAEANITLNITDGSGTASQVAGTLSALSQTTAEQEAAAAEENLTFDGWYTDAAFTQKYSNGMDATALYGRYMAAVTIDDGYATVYTALVTPGTAMSEPTDDDVLQYYMGEIVYYTLVDSEGNILSRDDNGAAAEFDFSTKIETNTSLRVMWASPYINYDLNSTGGLVARGLSEVLETAPVVSIPAYATLENESSARLVEAVVWSDAINYISPSATTLIFADGIKYISGVWGSGLGVPVLNSVVLPDTLKILDTAFWNLQSVTSFDLPDGLEIIINSLWGNYSINQGVYTMSNYSFDIEIPSTVTNISRAPSNFVYAESSTFWYDEATNATYKKGTGNDYETLIAMYGTGDIITVKSGVEFIQVGTFNGTNFDYLYIPSSFKNVAYNANSERYPYYTDAVLESDNSNLIRTNGFKLYDATGTEMTQYGYSIVNKLDLAERVIFDTSEKPADMLTNAIQGIVNNSYVDYTNLAFDDEDKVVFTGEIESGESVAVRVRAIYEVNGEYQTYPVSGIVSGGKLTEQAILDAIGFDSTASVVVSITQFGDEYFASESEAESGKTVNCRQYIEVVYSDNPGGAVIELVDGVMTVTGFDASTAIGDSNSGYTVTIPAMYEDVAVTAIAEGAFKGNKSIVTVSIPSSVTVIGAEAFMNTINLTTVTIAPGGLSVIGRSAFENSGFTSIALPLENLTDVQPYAFKSEKLQYFTAAEGETPLTTMNFVVTSKGAASAKITYIDPTTIGVGTFGFTGASVGGKTCYVGLFKYTGSSIETQGTTEVTVYDVQFIAVAGGMQGQYFKLGLSMRGWLNTMPMVFNMMYTHSVVRYEVMEGSVYYLNDLENNTTEITFGIVSKVHANAFTDMAEGFTADTRNNHVYQINNGTVVDIWLTTDDLSDTEIFEDGWWEGIKTTDENYSVVQGLINRVTISDSTLSS